MLLLLLITIMSMLLAAIMSAIAWHVGKEEQRRAAARVAALAEDIHRDVPSAWRADAPDEPSAQRRVPPVPPVAAVPQMHGAPDAHATRDARSTLVVPDFDLRPRTEQPVASTRGELFASTESSRPAARVASVIAAVVLVVAGAAALFVVSSYGRSAAAVSAHSQPATATAASASAPRAATPLELVALGHEREGDRLTVHGIVRNPSGAELDGLTAVVFVFNRDGGFVASGRAAVASTALPPGAESKFAVTVPNATDVARYRVSFRTDDRVVPHVDRRAAPLAQEKS